jgi:hypothetical protein
MIWRTFLMGETPPLLHHPGGARLFTAASQRTISNLTKG